MKKTMKKILALTLTMLMLLSIAAPVFANDAAVPACVDVKVHTKKNLGNAGVTYKFISEHKPETCSDPYYNVYQCDACGEYFADDIVLSDKVCDYAKVVKAATCTEEGTRECTVCGDQITDPKIPHAWKADIPCGNEGQTTTYTCEVCKATKTDLVEDNHVWNITVTKEPTCKVDGTAHYECTLCNAKKDVVIKADADHVGHNWVYANAVAGGCFKEDGGKEIDTINPGYYCADCGIAAYVGQVLVLADGTKVTNETLYSKVENKHDIQAAVNSKIEPTCLTYGFEFKVCTKCGWVAETIAIAPKGHVWEREGFDWTTVEAYIDPAKSVTCSKDGIGKTVYTLTCSDPTCGMTVDVEKVHTPEQGKKVDATCIAYAYTCDSCEICGEYNIREVGNEFATDHRYYTSAQDVIDDTNPNKNPNGFAVTTPATCITNGVATAMCRDCGTQKFDAVVPATGHSYRDAQGNLIDALKVRDCLTGNFVYTCTNAWCTAETEGHVFKVAIPGWNFNDLTFHQSWDATTGTWTGTHTVFEAGNCTTARVEIYTCELHKDVPITINKGIQHDIPYTHADYRAATPATCTTNGHVGYEWCTKCDYVKGVKGDDGIIKAPGHDWDEATMIAPLDATCTTKGHIGYRKCTVCGLEEGDKDGVINETPHNKTLMIDVNPAANNGLKNVLGSEWAVTCTKYTYTHYYCDVCHTFDAEIWENYVPATGHDMVETVPAGCTTEGRKECANNDCGFEDGHKHFEILPILKHINEKEQVIECVTEDFWCYRCCEPKFDADNKFTGEYALGKIDWRESHYELQEYTPEHLCTEYWYTLYTCNACKEEWTVNGFVYDEHKKPDASIEANWVITTPAPNYYEAGIKSLLCANPGCTYEYDRKEYGAGVEFVFEFDSAVKSGAHVVNSGYLAVNVYTNAYKQSIHSVDFLFSVDGNLFDLVKIEVQDETSPFYGMFFAAQNGNKVHAYGTVQNDTNSMTQNITLNGKEQYLVTLIFKVADDANTENSTIETLTGFIADPDDTLVNRLDGSVVNSAFAGYRNDWFVNFNDTTDAAKYAKYLTYLGVYNNFASNDSIILGPVANDNNDDATDDEPYVLTIYILGDVNKDAGWTNGKVTSPVDVNMVRDYIAKGEYCAEADIDKSGAITISDFEYLATYHVGGMDYAALCATINSSAGK